ncbi:MAG: FlgD immunoglobulin-like domain containing protein, partial [Candidatus Eiseniibacteriota bacterium]
TPPAPLLTFPAASQVLKDTITVLGSAADARFKEYRLEYRPSGSANWTLLRQSSSPVLIGALAGWNTRLLADGNYDLRLSVADTIGLSSSVAVTVTIDNVFPSADVTVPVLVREAEGGNVYTNTGDTHLYFPPHAFAQDAVVSVQSTPADSVPANLAAGLARVIPGWDVAWAAPLLKSARLDVGLSGFTGDMSTLAIYYDGGAGWSRLGGTIDPTARRLQLAVTQPGRYAVFGGTVSGAGEKTLGNLAFTPRVFSPSGTFADRNVGISFALGSPAPVTIRVYSMSGRMIREVASGQPMNAGQNMVKWDGRDHDGGIVTDGMYLVSVEALGQLQKKPLAVVK